MDIVKFMVDGPPCSGKSSFLARAYQFCIGLGYATAIVPEAVTAMKPNGIKPEFFKNPMDFQNLVLRQVRHNEDLAVRALKMMKSSFAREKVIALYDRGGLSGRAYCDFDDFVKMLAEEFGTTREAILQSYDVAAVMKIAPEEFYTCANNEAREEDYSTASKLGVSMEEIWQDHRNAIIIGNNYSGGFDGKVNAAMRVLARSLDMPKPLVIEQKFLVSDLGTGEIANFIQQRDIKHVKIVQHYLNDSEQSIRAWTRDGITTYFHRKKSNIPKVKRMCVEKIITKEAYYEFIKDIDSKCAPIEKTRYYFVYGDQYFRLDIFAHMSEYYLLEAQPTTLHQEIVLPDFLGFSQEVTDDPRYYNYNIAVELAKQRKTVEIYTRQGEKYE